MRRKRAARGRAEAAAPGRERILDRVPSLLHDRVPLVFGARDEVKWIERYHLGNAPKGETSPLFGQRGLFVREA